jgi:tetratricopeptide (TPR) repeat protein
MSTYFQLLLLAALAWLGFVLFTEGGDQSRLDEPDKSKVLLLYFGVLLDGGAIAAVLAVWIVPIIGESVGNFFFNPGGGEYRPDDHATAAALRARGDPEGAIALYEKILEDDPSDAAAVVGIARIYAGDLDNTARAAATLARALERDWTPRQSSMLANQLADIYLLKDSPRLARDVIAQVARVMPGTKFAENAQQRVREIDHAIQTGTRAPAYEEPESGRPG